MAKRNIEKQLHEKMVKRGDITRKTPPEGKMVKQADKKDSPLFRMAEEVEFKLKVR